MLLYPSVLNRSSLDTTICSHCKREFSAPSPVQSPPPQILHSDHVPSDPEIFQNKAILEEQEDILPLYDGEIAHLQTVLGKLTKERDVVRKRIKEHRNAISAHRRIPDEIWSEIFSRCVCDGEYSLSANDKVIKAPTLYTSQVCSRWRRIIYAIPEVWSSFHIDLYSIKRNISPLIDLYLGRSGKSPLQVYFADFSMKCDRLSFFTDKRDVELIVGRKGLAAAGSLMKALDRFGSLDIEISLDLLDLIMKWGRIEPTNGASFSRLKRLTISFNHRFSTGRNRPFWHCIRMAPHLSQIVFGTETEPELLSLPQVRSVGMVAAHSADDILRVLRVATSLKCLTVSFINHKNAFHPLRLATSSLRQLYLYDAEATGIDRLFCKLSLPSITTLLVESCQRSAKPPFSLQSILAMIQKSSGSLKDLTLLVPIRLSELIKILEASPQLTRLAFDLPGMSGQGEDISEFVSRLTINPGIPIIAPALTELCINGVEDTISWDAGIASRLFQMLDSRAQSSRESGRLTDVQLSFHHATRGLHQCSEQCRPGVDPVFLERAKVLEDLDGGMDLTIEYSFYIQC
ncbi:hypothetical protein V5O48_000164 [Marasmius crinis-equi]|uniref:F-box domain-containing protein n=1 Tax=Marasmius crinis-equi TaxID=585013 RepID=A0ABR3G2F8_9AGAR